MRRFYNVTVMPGRPVEARAIDAAPSVPDQESEQQMIAALREANRGHTAVAVFTRIRIEKSEATMVIQ